VNVGVTRLGISNQQRRRDKRRDVMGGWSAIGELT